MQAPRLEPRSRQQIVDAALQLAAQYTPEWGGVVDPRDPGRAMIELFARLFELLAERLNRVPEKNFLSFLDFTGIERFPGSPAEAPVSFLVAKSAPLGGLVPAGTRVATPQSESSDAKVFETRRAFFATPAKLERIVALISPADRYVELPVPAPPDDPQALSQLPAVGVFDLAEPTLLDIPHIFYMGSAALFGRKDGVHITLRLHLSAGTLPTATIEWRSFRKDQKAWIPLSSPVVYDFSVAGQIGVTFGALAGVEKTTVDGVEDFWLAAHFTGPFDASFTPPVVTAVEGIAAAPSQSITSFDAAFRNTEAIDLSKPYHPFGRRPAYADVFYIASRSAFGADVEEVMLTFTIRPYVIADLATQFAGVPLGYTVITRVVWQYLDAAGGWQDLATYEHEFQFSPGPPFTVVPFSNVAPLGDHAGEGTFIGQGGAATATVALSGFQDLIGLQTVNGVENRWVRALLLSDDPYGDDGVFDPAGPTFIGPLFIPPTIEAVQINYVPRTTPVPITNLKTLNNFELRDHAGPAAPFEPFVPAASRLVAGAPIFGTNPALYFAFDRRFGQAFISMFAHLAGPASPLTSPLESGNPQVVWEYWSVASRWASLDVEDETADLTASGTLGFTGPDDSAAIALFPHLDAAASDAPHPRHWFRARLSGGSYDHPPRLLGLHLNTTVAENRTVEKRDVIVGSSNGEAHQVFSLIRSPVLGGEIWVREPEIPSEDELRELEAEFREAQFGLPAAGGSGPIVDVRAIDGDPEEIWVRWRRIPNFLASGPRSRHHTLDGVAGVIAFGSGVTGLIPPLARDNVVIRGFATGGGEEANAVATPLAIQELKTSLPFIDRVFNVQAAAGGADAWSVNALLEFGPQSIKNRGRSVTAEDYEWMILERFSEVARARCLATRAPAPGGGLAFKAGAVTLIVVPKGEERRPQPSQALIRRIRDFLAGTSLGAIAPDIHVKGPDYADVGVFALLAPESPELSSVVLRRASAAIERFLHPIKGGEDGLGYGFGRAVYLSEVQAVLERIEGLDHVEEAAFIGAPGAQLFFVSENRLASSGVHDIRVV